MRIEDAIVADHKELTPEYRVLTLDVESVAAVARPGQFVHIRIPDRKDLALRRPFSIHKAGDGLLSILYKAVGEGTDAMCALDQGDTLSVMGPLGNGFPIGDLNASPVLVAGGYGVAPLYMLAKELPGPGILFVGGASGPDILMTELFEEIGWTVRIATEDGSRGTEGYVTAALDQWLEEADGSVTKEFYACGPDAMLSAISDRATAIDAKAWLSMDRHMGCGAGACLACVIRVRDDASEKGWARVCKDGPVFECRRIVWA
jgi:dihydroorotate dehydrogenase electron transfer subunit